MRRIIIAGLALLTALGAVLGCSASPPTAATAGTPPTAGTAMPPSPAATASTSTSTTAGVASTDGSEQASQALAASYDGQSWTIASVRALAQGSSEFNAVTCPSANYCVAVGEGGGPGGTTFSNAALTGFWNGKSWKLVGAS
jgi:hypothetical protein